MTRPSLGLLGVLLLTACAHSTGGGSPPRRVYVTTPDSIRLAVEVFGEGADTLIVPLSNQLVADLRPLWKDRVVVAYDPRSRGASQAVREASRLGLEFDVADLEAVRQALSISRADVLGWSYFAGVVAQYAARHPDRVRNVVLLAPVPPRFGPYPPGTRTEPSGPDTALAASLARMRSDGASRSDPIGRCRLAHQIDAVEIMGSAGSYARRLSDPCVHPNEWPDSLGPVVMATMTKLGQYDWRPTWRNTTAPALIIMGDRDMNPVAAGADWADRAGASLVVVPGVGHYPHLEAPEQVFDAIRRFLFRGRA